MFGEDQSAQFFVARSSFLSSACGPRTNIPSEMVALATLANFITNIYACVTTPWKVHFPSWTGSHEGKSSRRCSLAALADSSSVHRTWLFR